MTHAQYPHAHAGPIGATLVSPYGDDSDSAMPRLDKCPASGALFRVDAENEPAIKGTAGHFHMRQRVELGLDEAMARIDEVAHAFELGEVGTNILRARCKSFLWTPPVGALAEVPLVLYQTGEVERVVGGQGRYQLTGPYDLPPGTIDVMWSHPQPLDWSDPHRPRCPKGSTLWVGDYKFGDEVHVAPVERNAQLTSAACKAARWTGAESVMLAVIFVRPGQGIWDTLPRVWGAADLAAGEEWARNIVARVAAARDAVARGQLPVLREGRHCTYCPAELSCPTKTALIKSLAGAPITPNGILTEEQRVWAAERLALFERGARMMRQALRMNVDLNGPIETSEGTWGPVVDEVKTIDARAARPILVEMLGEEVTDKMVRQAIPRKALDEGVRAALGENTPSKFVSAKVNQIWRRLHLEGAIRTYPDVEYKMHVREGDRLAFMEKKK